MSTDVAVHVYVAVLAGRTQVLQVPCVAQPVMELHVALTIPYAPAAHVHDAVELLGVMHMAVLAGTGILIAHERHSPVGMVQSVALSHVAVITWPIDEYVPCWHEYVAVDIVAPNENVAPSTGMGVMPLFG